MARQRTSVQWQQLMAAYDGSGQSVAAFCREHGISQSNFYRRRAVKSAAFVTAKPALPSRASVAVALGDVVVRCDDQTSVAWLSALISQLRS